MVIGCTTAFDGGKGFRQKGEGRNIFGITALRSQLHRWPGGAGQGQGEDT